MALCCALPISVAFSSNNVTSHAQHQKISASTSALISGGNSTHILQRSLLFQAAVSLAAEGYSVTYICSEPFHQLPQHVHGMTKPEPNLLEQVKFVYIKTVDELIKYLCSFHLMAIIPDALLVDTLSYYTGQMQDATPEGSIARISAYLTDVQQFMLKKRCDGDLQFKMMLSTQDLIPSHLTVYQRFFPEIWTISGHPPENVELHLFDKDKTASSLVITLRSVEEIWVKEVHGVGGKPG